VKKILITIIAVSITAACQIAYCRGFIKGLLKAFFGGDYWFALIPVIVLVTLWVV
jgi:hypothetical protein